MKKSDTAIAAEKYLQAEADWRSLVELKNALPSDADNLGISVHVSWGSAIHPDALRMVECYLRNHVASNFHKTLDDLIAANRQRLHMAERALKGKE